MKVIVIGALPSSLSNFRGKLLEALVDSGCTTVGMASGANSSEILKVEETGAEYIDYPVERNGLNPIKDLVTLFSLVRTFRKERPDVILAYTIKPVIWGGIASRIARTGSFFGLITGLGYAFESGKSGRKLLSSIVARLYSVALKKSSGIIFQNKENKNTFVDCKMADPTKTHVVDGSGVDIDYFNYNSLSVCQKTVTFLMVARILRAKGVIDFIESSQIVKQKYPLANFQFIGPEDPSPDSLKKEIFEGSCVDYLGLTNDVRAALEGCSVFVLPSYYNEGLPRSTQEAMATGRPIITTDHVGCRETVIEGKNGFLVPINDVTSLAERMIWMLENQDKLERMGYESRRIVEQRFDVRSINEDILRIMGIS